MMLLVDTSVWIAHLRGGEARLAAALVEGRVWMHPFVLGEVACGNLSNRREVLGLLGGLAMAPRATDAEALAFIEGHGLMGKGIGYVDVHLLASAALLGGGKLWTLDRRLGRVAAALKLAHAPKGRAQ